MRVGRRWSTTTRRPERPLRDARCLANQARTPPEKELTDVQASETVREKTLYLIRKSCLGISEVEELDAESTDRLEEVVQLSLGYEARSTELSCKYCVSFLVVQNACQLGMMQARRRRGRTKRSGPT